MVRGAVTAAGRAQRPAAAGRRRAVLTALATVAAAAVPAPLAHAGSQPPTGWDGTNPFQCVLQQAGFGPVGPDPDADPYCVEFDKRRQNVTELGVVDFLSKEPGRVAQAVPKCFYFQSDHWRGSVVQEDGTTKTYEWDGHYFFDKARGEGGVWVTNFNLNGRTEDPSKLPGMPAEYARHFGPGTGGVITRNEVRPDPQCAARADREGDRIYARPPGAPNRRCPAPSGSVTGRRLGPVGLGGSEASVRAAMGDPLRVHRGWLRFCVPGGTKYMVAITRDRSGSSGQSDTTRAVAILTTNPFWKHRGIGRGASASAARRAFPDAHRLGTVHRTTLLATRRGSPIVVGLHRGRVRLVLVYDRARVTARELVELVRRSA